MHCVTRLNVFLDEMRDVAIGLGFDLALQAVLEQASQSNSLHVVRAITDDAAAAIVVKLPDDHQAGVSYFFEYFIFMLSFLRYIIIYF